MKSFAVATTLLAALPLAYSAPSPERVAEIYNELNGGIVPWVEKYTAPDIVWNIPGSGDLNRVYNQSEYLSILVPTLAAAVRKFPTYTVVSSYSDGKKGDWSQTEIHGRGGEGVQGTPINLDYAFFTKWEGETMVAINEYLDTLLLQQAIEEAGEGSDEPEA